MSPATRKWIEELAGVAAVLGPVLLVSGAMVKSIGNLGSAFGGVVGLFQKFSAAEKVTTVLADGSTQVTRFGTSLDALKATFGAASLTTMGWIAIIVLVIAALVLAYIKVKWFRDAVNDCVKFIVKAFIDFGKAVADVVGFIIRNWKTFLDYFLIGVGPIGWVCLYIINHFKTVETVVEDILKALWTAWEFLWNDLLKYAGFGLLVDAFKAMGDNIGRAWADIVHAIEDAINAIDTVLNKAFGWLIGGNKFKTNLGSSGSSVPSGGLNVGPSGAGNRTAQSGGGIASGVAGDVGSFVKSAAGSVWNGASDFAHAIYDVADLHLPGLPKIPGPLGGLMGGVVKLVKKAIEKLIGGSGGGSFLGKGSPNAIVAFAEQFLGVPYLWGGTSPKGWDCSGFVGYVYRHFGIDLLRTAHQMQTEGRPVTGAMRPSDLVFFGNPAHHVGMYVGGDTMIDAPYTGAFTRFDSNFTSWSDYAGARRYIAAALGGTISGPSSGYPVIMHGTETVVSHTHPQRGLAALSASGVGGDTTIVQFNFPEGIVVSDLDKFGRTIQPYVERATRVAAARRARGRVGT